MVRKKRNKEEELGSFVDDIVAEEVDGDGSAFAGWLYSFYLACLSGSKLAKFESFIQSPLSLDMIADWENDCTTREDRIELIDHIMSSYTTEDFDEPEHFDADGNSVLPER